MTVKSTCEITLNGLVLSVLLGWTGQERARTQEVVADVTLLFRERPAACQTDRLEDTVCYDRLVTHLRESISGKKFRLLEHLAAELWQLAKKTLPPGADLTLRVTKRPSIPGLLGGVSCTCSEPA